MRVYLLPCPAPCDSAQRAALRPADLAVDAFTQADATTWYAVIPGRTDALGTRWARIAFEHVWNAPPGVLPGGAQVVYVGIGADVAETELPAVEKTIVTLRSSM